MMPTYTACDPYLPGWYTQSSPYSPPGTAPPAGQPAYATLASESPVWRAVISSANELGASLHRVRRREITLPEAATHSMKRGIATSAAVTAAGALTSGDRFEETLFKMVAMTAATFALSYLASGMMNAVGRK